MGDASTPTSTTKHHISVIIGTALCAIGCGTTFLFALFRQFGLVEVAASLVATLEVFFLSSSIGDFLENRPQPNRKRFLIAVCLVAAVIAYFLVMRSLADRAA